MQTIRKQVRWGLTVLVLSGILGFGAQEALAGNRAHSSLVCENYPGCESTAECDECCVFLGNDSGFCTMAGACLCS